MLNMTEKQDQRICIKFCFQLGKMSSETIQMVQKAFGNECMSKTRIKEWYNRFKGGRTSVDSDSRSGRSSTTKKLDNIEQVRIAIEGGRRLTFRELENDLGIPKTTVWEILNKILGMTHVCAVTGFFTTITRQRIHRILRSNFWRNTRLYSSDSLSYSPDIAPCDFWMFPKLKMALKGKRFDDIETIQSNATRELKAIPKSELQDCSEK